MTFSCVGFIFGWITFVYFCWLKGTKSSSYHLVVERDSLRVIQTITDTRPVKTLYGHVIEEIRILYSSVNCSLLHINRNSNKLAYVLARSTVFICRFLCVNERLFTRFGWWILIYSNEVHLPFPQKNNFFLTIFFPKKKKKRKIFSIKISVIN